MARGLSGHARAPASIQSNGSLLHLEVSVVLVFANLELLSERGTRRFLDQVAEKKVPHHKSVWVLSNHGGPTARAILRDAAKWLIGPVAPIQIDWIMRHNPFTGLLNGCENKTTMRRMVVSVCRHVPLRLLFLDNMNDQELSRPRSCHDQELSRPATS